MSYSRSCKLFSSLCFLQFGESLGNASNKQEHLMMNSGKVRIPTQTERRETRFQRCLSFTVWYKEKKENNKLKKLLRQAIIGGLPLSVCLPCLGILKLILAVNLILMIFDNFVVFISFWPKASPLFFFPNFVFQTSQRQCKDCQFKLPRALIPSL